MPSTASVSFFSAANFRHFALLSKIYCKYNIVYTCVRVCVCMRVCAYILQACFMSSFGTLMAQSFAQVVTVSRTSSSACRQSLRRGKGKEAAAAKGVLNGRLRWRAALGSARLLAPFYVRLSRALLICKAAIKFAKLLMVHKIFNVMAPAEEKKKTLKKKKGKES